VDKQWKEIRHGEIIRISDDFSQTVRTEDPRAYVVLHGTLRVQGGKVGMKVRVYFNGKDWRGESR
jgi:hypothetical protein